MSKFLNISTDNTLGGSSASDNTVSSQKAVKDYVDSKTSSPAFADITGQPTDNTNLATALNAKYDASNPNGYTSNVGTVTSVNNVSPVNGNVSLTIPTVNNATLTIQKNGTTVKTFTANASSNVTANITVPTVTDTYSATSSDGMSGKAVASAISGLQPTSTAVTHTASTAVGSATKGVYIASNGTATEMTYEVNKSVPADAVFTDTTYSDYVGATSSADGVAGLVPAATSANRSKFLRGDGTWQTPTNTKNTAGSTDTSSKIFLVGATEQSANPQTYSHDTAFVDTNGRLNSAAPASNANDTTVATTKWVKDQSYVPTSRTINSKALSSNITLSASDVGAVASNTAITGATKCKITYDSKGLVTAGADLQASDIPSLTLSKISDVTATATELNVLDGITATTTELNYTDGVTSNIQTQLNAKAADNAVVKLTGNQTIAGNKTFTSTPSVKMTSPNICVQYSGISKGTAPSSTTNGWFGTIYDKNGTAQANKMAQIYHSYYSNGTVDLCLALFTPTSGSTNGDMIKLAYNGTNYYTYCPAPTEDTTSSSQIDTVGARNTKLANYVPTTRKINNKALSSDITLTASDVGALDYYGTCDTAAATQVKAVTCAGFVLATGATVRVKFTNYQNYNGSFKLNVNSTGDIEVKRYGTTNSARYDFRAGQVVAFTYDGTYWQIEDTGLADTTYFGKTKLSESATSTSTNLALALKGLNSFAQNMISNAPVYSSSSTYAVGDRVRYSYNTYECNTAITTAESWTAAHWTALPDLQAQIDSISSSSDTVGTVKAFAGSTAPTGWLKCDGSAISRTTYSALFAVIGTTYGSGNGSTTFNVPNVKLQGGTISVLGDGKCLRLTNKSGVTVGLGGYDGADTYANYQFYAFTGKSFIDNGGLIGSSGGANGTYAVSPKAYGVVTSGESGLVVSSTQTVNAIIKY